MFGRIDLPTVAVLLFALLAAGTDLAYGRIFNWLTVSAAVLGLIYATISHGLPGLGSALLGMLAGLVLYGWMFWFRVLGGGDVKLLMAFGAWGGPHFALEVALVGIMLGGIMAALLLAAKGRFRDFFTRLYHWFLTLIVKELELEKFKMNREHTMPFGVPIAAAAIWVQLGAPFFRGGHPW